MKNNICSKCNSKDVLGGIPVLDRSEPAIPARLSLVIRVSDSLVDALSGEDQRVFELRAWVCADCGYTELYTLRPAGLKDAFQERLAQKRTRRKP